MSFPGFTAEVSLHGTSGHYRRTGTLAQTDGASLQQLVVPSRYPGIHYCSPCYRESTGAWVRYCVFCPGGQLPDGCSESLLPCPRP